MSRPAWTSWTDQERSDLLTWAGLARNDHGQVLYAKANGNGPLHLYGLTGAVLCGVKRAEPFRPFLWEDGRDVCTPCAGRARAAVRREARESRRAEQAARPVRRSGSKDDLGQISEIYLAAAHAGAPPIRAVQDQLGLSYARAADLCTRARKAGLLPKTSPRRIAKAVAVADALGVDYEQLVAAIMEHANGTLHVVRGTRHAVTLPAVAQ